MSVIQWGGAGRLALRGLSSDEVTAVADRWCGEADFAPCDDAKGVLRLCVPEEITAPEESSPVRVRIRLRAGEGREPVELSVGPHAVVLGSGSDADVVRFAETGVRSRLERDLLVDLAINHLLARQGLPVIHSCAFELGGASVLGLGESFSGKTTASVAAMRAGGRVVSDDSMLVVPGERAPHALLPVRSYGWLRGRTREIVPHELRDRMVENEEDGRPRWVLNREDGGAGFVDSSEPNVVWIQSVDRRLQESRIAPVDHGRVFAALIRASSPLYLSRHCPEIREQLIPVFRGLCAQCRGFRVRLGRRLLEDPVGEMKRLVEASR